MRARIACVALAALAAAPVPLAAHPHMFIDTGVEFVFDEAGRLAALRVGWVYDAFSSMLYFEDLGLDTDYDGILTEAELAALQGFDMVWDEGFDGDLVLLSGEERLDLGPPQDWTADVVEGRIVSTHLRAVPGRPDPAAGLVLRVYDESYYTAYTILDPVRLRGRSDCVAEVWEPDLDRANDALAAAMGELLGGDIEADFPAVGSQFAEEIRLNCLPLP
jgi:ABC-type uncharacterized transport system substrate-binding protein